MSFDHHCIGDFVLFIFIIALYVIKTLTLMCAANWFPLGFFVLNILPREFFI